MKKILFIFAAAVLAFSCSKKDDGKDIDTAGQTLLTADLESLSGLAAWEEGSQIGVFGTESGVNCLYTLRQKFVGSTLADFYGPLVKGDILAYYPYNPLLQMEDGCIPFELPSTQAYLPDATAQEIFSTNVNRAFAADKDGVLHFIWGCGLLEITLGMNEAYAVSELSVQSEYEALSGVFMVDKDLNFNATGSTSGMISVDFGGQVIPSREGDELMKVLVAIPAGYYDQLTIKLDSPTDGELVAKASEVFIERIESSEIKITSVSVGTGGIPALPVTPGYIEED